MKPQRKTVHDCSSMITYYMDVLTIITVAGSAVNMERVGSSAASSGAVPRPAF